MNKIEEPPYFNSYLLRRGLVCPVKLFYKANDYPEDISVKPFLRHAGFNKHYLKLLAGSNYPDATLIKEGSKKEAAQKTARLLDSDHCTLKEAAFIYRHYYAKVPLLQKDGHTIRLIDIQIKSINPRSYHLVNKQGRLLKKWKSYIINLAYKQFVLQQIFPAWTFEMQLWLPHRRKQSRQHHLLQALARGKQIKDEDFFCKLDVTDLVQSFISWRFEKQRASGESFDEVVSSLCDQYINPRLVEPPIGKKCGRCEFRLSSPQIAKEPRSGFEECWTRSAKVSFDADEPLVLDLIGPGTDHWLKQGIYLQKEIEAEDVHSFQISPDEDRSITQKQRQALQIRKAKGLDVPREVIMPSLFDKMNEWQYPLHFLDFEAGNFAVPIRANRSPYHPVLFQFSCHTLQKNGHWKHHQWMAESAETYPNYELIRQLMGVPHINKGTISYYSNFEKYSLKSIRKELKTEQAAVKDASELVVWLDRMLGSNRHAPSVYWVDLSRLVPFYYNHFMDDSLSVKSIVQSVLSVSDYLKEIYTSPYNSHNFDDIIWWQWDEKNECAQNPYQILRRRQGDIEVGRGTEAMVLFGKMLVDELSGKRSDEAKQAMLKYCELDTLALMMIAEHWQQLKGKL